MIFDIHDWMENYIQKTQDTFGGRVWFIGLQGSYGRGEATEQSDIDVVLILDRVTAEDLKQYSRMLDSLPNREKVCGFVSGKAELLAWEPSDLFQFCFDTTPVIGSLKEVEKRVKKADVERAVRIGVCNIYHMCAHNMLHEKSSEMLSELYKASAFTLQAIAYLQTGQFEKQQRTLLSILLPEDRKILEIRLELKEHEGCQSGSFQEYSELLLHWTSRWILKMES